MATKTNPKSMMNTHFPKGSLVLYSRTTRLLIILFTSLSISSCSWKNQEMEARVHQLGVDIVNYVHAGDYNAPLPEELVHMGNNTFWKILMISDPIDSIQITVHDASGKDDKADYFLDIGTAVGLRIKYDKKRNQFHILGYQGSQQKNAKALQDKMSDLDQNLYNAGYIEPGRGLSGIVINSTTRSELFNPYEENVFNKLDLWFDFENDTLSTLYISRYQLGTAKGIRPNTSTKNEIITHYGTPNQTKTTFNFLNKTIKNVEVLEYEGIAFILLQDDLMLIKVTQF